MNKRTGKKGSWTKIEQHIKFNEPTKHRRLKYLNKVIKGKNKILEVGCSSGFMLFDFLKKGNICHGIEPSGFFQKYLKNKIKLFPSLKNLEKKHRYDLIMHFFVLEHINNPIEFLNDQLKLLKKNGKIIFEIPCYQDALYKIYDIPEFERFYWSVAHPWYFNYQSLKYLLKKLNKKFKIIKDQRYDLSNHLYWMKYGKPGGMEFYSHKLGRDIEEKYKKNLVSRGYYDTLIGIIYN
jgi:SAM-dependent methyltransferase